MLLHRQRCGLVWVVVRVHQEVLAGNKAYLSEATFSTYLVIAVSLSIPGHEPSNIPSKEMANVGKVIAEIRVRVCL